MTQRYAVIDEAGVILTVALAETAADIDHSGIPGAISVAALADGLLVGPGWRRDGEGWAAPAGEAPPPLTLDQRRDLRRAEVNAKRDQVLGGGYQHNFGGFAGIRTLDNRDERDAINWLGLSALVDRMIATDQGSMQIAIRDAADDTFTASAQTVSNALFAMAGWRSAILARSWELKDEIAAAVDEEALAAIDIATGWPD